MMKYSDAAYFINTSTYLDINFMRENKNIAFAQGFQFSAKLRHLMFDFQ